VQTLRGMVVAALYAAGSYGFSYYISGSCKLLELVGIAAAVMLFHSNQLSAAAIMAACALVDLLIVGVYTYRTTPWARLDLGVFDRAWLASQVKPAVGLAISNFANQGILVQGPRVVLSALLGGHAVGLYAVYATAVRLVDQLLLMLALPIGMEISRAIGSGDKASAYRLVTLGNRFSWVLFVGVAAFLLVFGPLVFHIWTRGQVAFSYPLIGLYLLMSACVQVGRVSWIGLVSSNRMFGPSFTTVGFATAALLIGGLLTMPFGVAGMVVGGVFGEAANAAVMIFIVTRWLDQPISRFFTNMFDVGASIAAARQQIARLLARVRRRPEAPGEAGG
jgi:O-antigen/teichoic acid export membrane protein